MRAAKHSYSGVLLLRHLVGEEGCRIFTAQQAEKASSKLQIRQHYVPELLHYLSREGWVTRLKRGLYAINSDSGLGAPPHEYEIATALVTPCAISHWTAMHYHHLTQQIPNKIFALTTTGSSIPRSIDREHYHYVQIKPDHYFGLQQVWVGEAKVLITDLERTLLDGLMAPQHCGDFQEVLAAFKVACQKIVLKKLVDYALKMDVAVVKRLGWILENLGHELASLHLLQQVPIKGFRKLDPSHPSQGPYNNTWMIQENI